jgi:hypothetical protein
VNLVARQTDLNLDGQQKGIALTNNIPEPDYFDELYVTRHERDTHLWKVVGTRNDGRSIQEVVIVDYVANKPLAESALRWYCDNYWKKMFEGPRDC